MVLEFLVKEQTIEMLPTRSTPRRGSRKYLTLRFTMSEDWKGLLSTAFLQFEDSSEPIPVPDSGVVNIPDFFAAKPYFQVFLVGVNGDIAIPTNVLTVNLDASGESWTAVPEGPATPDYQALMKLVQESMKRVSDDVVAFGKALKDYSDEDDVVGLPILDTAGKKYGKMAIIGTEDEMNGDRNCFEVPTVTMTGKMIENAGIAVARGNLTDGGVYRATGDSLPVVKVGRLNTWVGKGKQIIFIPDHDNSANPSLSINESDPIEIRMRESRDNLTSALSSGVLRRGVPYTMTFCGKYWLVDSCIVSASPCLKNFDRALSKFSTDGQGAGLPVLRPGGDDQYGMMELVGDEAYRDRVPVPTIGKVDKMIRDAVLSGYIDVTEDYEKALATGTVTCAREYLWMLGEGRYSISVMDKYDSVVEKYYLHAFHGEFHNGNGLLYRILIRAQDFYDIEFHNDDNYDSEPVIMIMSETGHIYFNGKQCNPTDLITKNGKLYLAHDGFIFGDGVTLPQGSGGSLLTVETITVGEVGNIPVTGIELDYATMSINEGESFQLAASVLPENATNNVVGWSSSDSSIATVVDGFVTGVSGGSVTITAYSLENNAITATCTVTVSAESGGGSTTDGKIMLLDRTPVNTGVILKNDGTTEFSHSSCYGYFVIPYSEGMVVSTVMTSSFAGNTYGPIFVRENGTLTRVTPESKTLAGAITNYTATLTGYSENAEVIVNVTNANRAAYSEYCYYIQGGEE